VPRPSTPSISITLSPSQVEEIMRAAQLSEAPTVSSLITSALAGALEAPRVSTVEPPAQEARADEERDANRRLSRSLLRGLSILTCFSAESRERGIVEIARELGMSASTTHRYALTLVELGLLERCPRTRKYRLATAPA
jgi:hypothetical protein